MNNKPKQDTNHDMNHDTPDAAPPKTLYRSRLAAQSDARKKKGFPHVDLSTVTVPLTIYTEALDELDRWKRRAVDAESRLTCSGSVLGEGRLPLLQRSKK